MIRHFLRFNENGESDLNGKFILYEDALVVQEAYEKLMEIQWNLRWEINELHKMLDKKEEISK
jgi:hypothetical protein